MLLKVDSKILQSDENYQLAKALKTLYDLCKTAGQEVARLDVTKGRAIEIEDYEIADSLKLDVERVKHALMAKMKILGLKLSEAGAVVLWNYEEATVDSKRGKEPEICIDRPKSAKDDEELNVQSIKEFLPKPILPPKLIINLPPPVKADRDTSTTSLAPLATRKKDQFTSNSSLTEKIVNIDEKPQDTPESLTDELKSTYDDSISVFGLFVVENFLSKQFRLREYALKCASERLEARHLKLLNDAEGKSSVKFQSVGNFSTKTNVGPEMIPMNNKNEMKVAESVNNQVFLNGILRFIAKGLQDSREKVSVQSVALWSQFTS
jgi:hypothetical protein